MGDIHKLKVTENKIYIENVEYTYDDFVKYVKSKMLECSLSDDATIEFTNCENVFKGGYNKIVYGNPGSGKSHYVDKELIPLIKNEKLEQRVHRVTFHPEYTYTDFIGQIIPHTTSDNKIEYIFNPGPFTISLRDALCKRDMPVILVIEEINRGNAPAIFGDIFQLLDRDEDGRSVFSIDNKPISDYFNDNGILKYMLSRIEIPPNMFIIATMNTSDQNVCVLDNAFKRRWDMQRYPNDITKCLYGNYYVPGTNMTWSQFVIKINSKIRQLHNAYYNEDKQIGVFFLKSDDLIKNDDVNHYDERKCHRFADKVLEYLWNDVLKNEEKSIIFSECDSFDELIKIFMNKSKDCKANEIFESTMMEDNNVT